MQSTQSAMALNQEQIANIVGLERLSDHQVIEIIEIGASEADLMEAFERTYRPGDTSAEVQHEASLTVRQLCEILSVEAELPDEDEAR